MDNWEPVSSRELPFMGITFLSCGAEKPVSNDPDPRLFAVISNRCNATPLPPGSIFLHPAIREEVMKTLKFVLSKNSVYPRERMKWTWLLFLSC